MTADPEGSASPGSSDRLSHLALRAATAIFFACLITMIGVAFWGSQDGFSAVLFDTCRTVLISSGAAIVTLLGVRGGA